MAGPAVTPVDLKTVNLRRASVEEYCRAVVRMRHNAFWWYFHGCKAGGRIWKPFRDAGGRWWWYVKPGFVWPVDFFSAFAPHRNFKPRSLLLGWQYPTTDAAANSRVHLNVIQDLSGYDLGRIARKKKRYGIRRALQHLQIDVGDPSDSAVANEACAVWNSHVARTGWNRALTPPAFRAGWLELATCPGTTLLTARDPRAGGELCAWLIARIIGDTVFIDTLSSHTDRVGLGPNDGLIFLCLHSAAKLGVPHAHYALKSRIKSLEAFKQSLGFLPHAYPCRLELRRPVAPLLRIFAPRIYSRLLGDESWMEEP